jgi:predicted dehydrogenase
MELEAVYVATPNNLHAENTRMLLEAGKHVLCEKPFTTNAKDAEALYRLAEEKGLFCMEAFWIRFLPLYENLLEMIHSGKYGALRHVRSEYGFIAKGARRERKFRSDLGGGALLDIGNYNLGFLQMLMGESPEAFSSEVTFNEYGTDSFSTISLRYPGGRTAYVLQTIGLDIARHAALFFDEATIRLPDFQGAQSMIIRPNGGEEYEIRCPFDVNGFEYEIREASRCIREGKSQSSRFTPEDSVKLLRLMDKIRETWGMRFSYE